MGKVLSMFDGLRNALTGTGTSRDARSASSYAYRPPMTQYEIAAAYQSGLMRKIVRIPALDMVREWRTWTGVDAEQAASIHETEKRLGLCAKVLQAETLRGMGGGALVLGLPGDASSPAPKTGEIAFVHVVSRWHLTFDRLEDDATKPNFGEPDMWRLATTAGQQGIHPSRVIPFRADTTPSLALPGYNTADAFWGESTIAQVLDAVKDSDTARASFAALLHKARLLRIGIPNLYEMMAEGKDEAVMGRLAVLATAESIHNATIYDAGDDDGKGGEEIKDAVYTFAGAKDVLNAYSEFVASISDIPATRLLGRAPEGMNSSGESQQKDWNKKVRAMQTLQLAPCLDRLTPYLAPATTAAYDFAPLDTPSEKENAERFKLHAEAIDKLQATGTIPDEAFARGVQSLMVEEGYLPELEAALAEMGDEERYGIVGNREEGGDLGSLGGGTQEPARLAANDHFVMTARDIRIGDLAEHGDKAGIVKEIGDHVLIEYTKDDGDRFAIDAIDVRFIGRLDSGRLTWGIERKGG